MKLIVEKIKGKAPSMRARGLAFCLEALTNLNMKDEETFSRIEKVCIAKIDEFIPHYLVKIMSSFYKSGFGSNELYDILIDRCQNAVMNQEMKYSDLIKFFEVYPEVTYIFDNTMSQELYQKFEEKIAPLIKDKKFPIDDLCRVFNIMCSIG